MVNIGFDGTASERGFSSFLCRKIYIRKKSCTIKNVFVSRFFEGLKFFKTMAKSPLF